MKTKFIFIFLFIGMILSTPMNGFAETITIVTPNFPPFTFIDESTGTIQGITYELTVASYKEAGVDVAFRVEPIKRAILSFTTHKAALFLGTEGLIQASGLPTNDLSGVYDGYIKSTFSYFKSHHNGKIIKWTKLSDLKPFKIGTISGAPTTALLKSAGLSVESTASLDSSVKKLQVGRIDLLEGITTANYFLVKTLFPQQTDDYAETEKPLFIDKGLTVFWKDDQKTKELVNRFLAGKKAIKKNGIFMKIQKKYWGENVPESILDSFGYYQNLRIDSL